MSIVLKTITIFCILFYSAFIVKSQISRHLTIEDGLSNNYVTDIIQDRQGFIWIATESGLNRFDGKKFTIYNTNNSKIVSNELNTLLYDDIENTLWIGTQREGISIFDCFSQNFKNYTMDDGLDTNDIIQLSHSADGKGIWITHYHVGIEYYDKKTKELTLFADKHIKNMESPNWCSFDDGNGNLYIGHVSEGLSILDIKNKTARNIRHHSKNPKSLPGNTVRSIHIDQKKNIWIGTNNGLALFNPQTEEFITFKHDPGNPNSIGSDKIYKIKEMRDGTLWICTDMSGISILNLHDIDICNPQKIKFRNLTINNNRNELASVNIRCLFQDSFDNIWIGHYRREIDFIKNEPDVFKVIAYIPDKYGEPNEKEIWTIHVDQDQQLWVGSYNEIAIYRNNTLIKIIDIKPFLSSSYLNTYITVIKSDRNGNIWIGTNNDGVLRLNPKTDKIERIYLGNTGEYLHDFYEDTEGKIWIGTETGIYSYQNNKVKKEEHINEQLGDKTIFSVIRDKQGKIWVGTFGKGIYIFDQNNNLIHNLEKNKGFCSNAINSLYLDSTGRLWAATRNGIACFTNTEKPEQYNIYNEKQKLENAHVRAIQEDRNGNIWISTEMGISLWDPTKSRFNNYNHQDGVPIGDFTTYSVSMNKEGIIFFGSLYNICYFNPSDLTKKLRKTSPVQIIECVGLNRKIESNNKDILTPSTNNKIELAYNRNSFRISFSSPDFSQNQQVEYAYMMEGLNNSWYNTLGENQVTFRNISPGKYTFKVKSRLKNQDWEDTNVAEMGFVVHPPLWLAWYAKLLYVIVSCFIIYFILRSYKRKLDLKTSLELEKKNSKNKQELNEERLRFYTNITHELRTPLTLILGPLEDLIHDSKLPSMHRNKINIIYASTTRLLNLINQILEFRKTETQNRKLSISQGNLASLVTEIGLRYKELNKNDKVNICINIETKNVILYFDPDIIVTILNNLLSNAMKYTTTGEVRLTLRSLQENDNDYTEILVSDTGYGMEPEALPHIFERYYQAKGKHQVTGTGIGLALVKSLAELHEGTLYVESTVGKGTVFSFRLLTENTYYKASVLKTEEKSSLEAIKEEVVMPNEENDDTRSTILVVEDNKEILEYIITSLTTNYHILSATNGKEGLTMAQQHIPNIIISDIMMPEMNGIELCRTVKEDINTSHIPVILLTAKDSIQDKEEGYDNGADSYLTKPFSARLLRLRISNILESRRKLAQQINLQVKGTIQENVLKPEPIKISKLDEEFLNKLTEIIKNNLKMEGLDIAFIKDKMNMSHSTFYRKVKGLTGMSANEFIRKIRLKNSLLFLQKGHQVAEVAFMSGFNDIAYFRKCFKEEYGMTPSEYIKKIKN